MVRAPSKNQMKDLWIGEYLSHNRHCLLCGNHGIIDTRGKVFTPAGVECGGIAFCICPNGRIMKRLEDKRVKQ